MHLPSRVRSLWCGVLARSVGRRRWLIVRCERKGKHQSRASLCGVGLTYPSPAMSTRSCAFPSRHEEAPEYFRLLDHPLKEVAGRRSHILMGHDQSTAEVVGRSLVSWSRFLIMSDRSKAPPLSKSPSSYCSSVRPFTNGRRLVPWIISFQAKN